MIKPRFENIKIIFILFIAFIQWIGLSGAAFSASQNIGSRQDLRSPVNLGGPEAWPENEGLSTTTFDVPNGTTQTRRPVIPPTDQPQPVLQDQTQSFTQTPLDENRFQTNPATPGQTSFPVTDEAPTFMDEPAPEVQTGMQETASETHIPQSENVATGNVATGTVGLPLGSGPAPQTPPQREVIYVDEAGNPVAKPPEPDKMYEEAKNFIDEGKFDDALPILEEIRSLPNLPAELRENVLYGISDCLWARYANNPLAGYEPVVTSTNEAMNANLRSKRVPDALLRLGLANLNVGNIGDANGYITALMRRFPDFPGVAQGFTALGEGQLKIGKNADAEKSFAIILDKYPESSSLQAASVGLAKALVNQNKDDKAQIILDFISKRWPRYYINEPEFLLLQAENDEKMDKDDAAMSQEWLYVNLDPARQENASLLLKMGDKYSKNGNKDAADFVYKSIREQFPESRPAVTSKLRLAEQGIHDSPITYKEMSEVFDTNGRNGLAQTYNELISSSTAGPDEVLARLKQAMWLYWDKQYSEAMGKASTFIDDYPEHKDIPEARDILWNAFEKELAQSLAEHNYGRILLLWNGFPYIRNRYGKIDAPLRYALAQGWQERGDDQKSYDLLAEFLKDPMDPQYGEAAFSQFFNHYLQNGDWEKILDLGEKVKNWKMAPELENQLEYAEALSAQNLNMGAAALNRWKRLAHRNDLPLYQQAYATYFLAKDAENRRDIRNAYEYNRKVVEMFTRLSDERSDKADPERIKEGISSLMDICEVGNRVPEALEWVQRYNVFVPQDSPEYPGLRFREARLYRKLGDNERAKALLEDVAQNFPESPFASAAVAELRTFDMSRDLSKFVSNAPGSGTVNGSGSTSGNWSSTTPSAQ